MKKGTILVVDDNRNVITALRLLLSNHFGRVVTLPSPVNLLTAIREEKPDVVLLDMNFSSGINTGNEGLYWLSQIKEASPDLPVVLFTAYADIELAVKALKNGATDFVVKPWDNSKLLATLNAALELRLTRNEVRRLKENQRTINETLDDVIWGESPAMREVIELVEKVARTDANVLITGENGTGKEVIAHRIHNLSTRNAGVFVKVDMGAIPDALFESELFGHIKGAFTDARQNRPGKFEAAQGGTLFLDEVGNLGYPLQAKLLTALQSRTVTRVGSNTPTGIDIRLITATNRDLQSMVVEGQFREDLLFRMNTIQIVVPPLRERKDDIPSMSRFFLERYARKYGKTGMDISGEALDRLCGYRWPGNVRELQHSIEKAVILSDSVLLGSSDLYIDTTPRIPGVSDVSSLEDMERIMVVKALSMNARNLSAAAQQLGITRPTLYAKMKKYGLE